MNPILGSPSNDQDCSRNGGEIECNQTEDIAIRTGQNATRMRNYMALSAILGKTGIFEVDVKLSPARGNDMTEFIVDFTPYDVVVLDYALRTLADNQ